MVPPPSRREFDQWTSLQSQGLYPLLAPQTFSSMLRRSQREHNLNTEASPLIGFSWRSLFPDTHDPPCNPPLEHLSVAYPGILPFLWVVDKLGIAEAE